MEENKFIFPNLIGAKYIKNVIDDPDAKEGVTFARWLATMAVNGIEIEWAEILDHS